MPLHARPPVSIETEGARAAAGMISGRLLIQGVAIATAVFVPRLMGPQQYGTYASIIALMAVFAALAEFGLGWIMMRFGAPAWREGRIDDVRTILATTWFTKLLFAAMAGLGVAVVLGATGQSDREVVVLVVVGLTAMARYVTTTNSNALIVVARRKWHVTIEFLRAAAALTAVLIGFAHFGLPGAFAGLLAVAVTFSVISLTILRSFVAFAPRNFSVQLLLEHHRFILWSAANQFFSSAQLWLPLFLVGAALPGAEAGYLGVAVQILGVIGMLWASGRLALMPILAEQIANRSTEQLLRWVSLALRLSAIGSCVVLIGWLGVGRTVIDWMWSTKFAPAFQVISLIVIAHLFMSLGAMFDALLTLHGSAASSAFAQGIFLSLTILGTVSVLIVQPEAASVWIALVYSASAMVFSMLGYAILGLRHGLWIPVKQIALAMAMAAAAALALLPGDTSSPYLRFGVVALFLVALPAAGILRWSEVRQLARALAGRAS